MFKSRAVKWVLGVLGAILVGAVGSGVWQGLLGPALRAVGIGLLDIVSLGFGSYKNSVYEQIAVDNPCIGAMAAFSILSFGILFFAGVISGALFGMWFWQVKHAKHADAGEGSPSWIDSSRVPSYVLFVVASVLTVACGINSAKVGYIYSAVMNYRQTLRVASPYLTVQERQMIDSQFAQIGTRQNYVDILDKLGKVAREHGQKVPQFEAW